MASNDTVIGAKLASFLNSVGYENHMQKQTDGGTGGGGGGGGGPEGATVNGMDNCNGTAFAP